MRERTAQTGHAQMFSHSSSPCLLRKPYPPSPALQQAVSAMLAGSVCSLELVGMASSVVAAVGSGWRRPWGAATVME